MNWEAYTKHSLVLGSSHGRPLLGVWPAWSEALWVYCWSVLGGILVWRIQHPIRLGLAGVTAIGVLYGVSFGLFIQGSWVPLVPSALALVVTDDSVLLYTVSKYRYKMSNK